MTGIDIPFNRASVGDPEQTYLAEALSSGRLSGDGPFTARASALLERLLGASKVLLTTSCTHALEMSALLLDIGPDDEVIVPSFAFVSTANAFRLHGGRPRFADVRRDTLNLDETKLESLITSRTKAIVVLHYGGIACAMETAAGAGDPARSGHRGRQRARAVRDLRRPAAGGPSGVWRPRAFTRQRTSPAARAGRWSSTIRNISSVPKSCARRGPTASGSCKGRSTSTPGLTAAPAICRLMSSPRCCSASSNGGNGFRRRASASGYAMPRIWRTGPRRTTFACRSYPSDAVTRSICST